MPDLSSLETILGIKFTNKSLLEGALIHRSYLNENPQFKESNERLEFLGDSVLQVLTSTELYRKFPKYPEGKLTNLRSAIVRTETLGKLARELHYGDFLLISKGEEHGGGRENLSLLANTFEAVLGAIYLDQGLPAAKTFLEKHLFSQMDKLTADRSIYDYKSKLQEVIQNKEKVAPAYEMISETGPDHDKTFTIAVKAGRRELARGTGKSKQEAEQEAARIALETLK
ncbi:ribonuclease III [Patescibacteria group bacterium]|nr:ribonuclease III [Patescibacteria group bacterium]